MSWVAENEEEKGGGVLSPRRMIGRIVSFSSGAEMEGGTKTPSSDSKEYRLKPEEELRLEVAEGKSDSVKLELAQGMAEIFGTELVCGNSYSFGPGSKLAVFTWHGCTLSIKGTPEMAYVARDTPMIIYLNTHAGVETLRKRAEKAEKRGPVVMLAGPVDVGKSTVTRILLNYATRMGRSPLYVDLDVGQSGFGIPGTIGASLVEQPASPDGEFANKAPLLYHYGSSNMGANPKFFKELCRVMADAVQKRLDASKKVKYSGALINTAGWVKDEGYSCLLFAVTTFNVDLIIVLDQERLYNELVRDVPPSVHVVYQPKSAGVVERSKRTRFASRMSRLRNYFYGNFESTYFPHTFDVKFSDLRIFKIGAPVVPKSCLPIGMTNEDAEMKLVQVAPSKELLNHMLSLSHATVDDEKTISTNIRGFIYVTNVDVERQTVTILSPQPRPLPDGVLLWSDVRFIDAN
ncbi:unnamed protein product [Notodromas monacha]|uniref:Protein CLP1 homolog n=1 Tax=Notodromas monacha TaxID=399045 RepID=A0A7R9BLY4_9CRUS|nr:unnamed protein product [Notodromas monacha]CAG0916574.1 unnamed protein product [Notodromas monacha]